MLKEKLQEIIATEKKLRRDKDLAKKCAIPENCYLLGNGEILCYPRGTGDSRYPYSADGLTLWAYASGEMSLNESAFYYILPADEGKEPYTAFFGGKAERDGTFTPISVTGVARQAREDGVSRFTYYTPTAVYYVTQTPEAAYALRAFVSADKKATFSLCALNLTNKPIKTYLSAFFNCLLMHQAGESVETKWFKRCDATDDGFIFESVEDLDRTTHLINYGVINRAVGFDCEYAEHTTSRADYVGGKTNSLSFASPLFSGHFGKQPRVCKFGDTAAAGDLYAFTLDGGALAQIDYAAEAHFNRDGALAAIGGLNAGDADKTHAAAESAYSDKAAAPDKLTMRFGKLDDERLRGETLTEFVSNVQRQVEFAALAKNSGTSLLGVRDVAQQMEAALMWNARGCRAKFIELFGFIDTSGRAPRQYSIPAKGALPQMDTRMFIDQGNWIISAVYSYLAHTDDYSLLDEACGYYKITGRNCVEATDERNSIAEHLARIADFMISNIDDDTECLRALYGDWNDALDGLGVSRDPDKEYGSGVSVMATLHLYRNLEEMLQIVDKYGDRFGKKKAYEKARERLARGLKKYAVEQKDGARKILHGWGDGRAYKVGSFCDVDGLDRDGLTANAFWVISGAYLWDKSIKNDILASYDRLDGKFGLRTFAPHFEKGVKGVGRIINLPEGTAENGATYVHASMFGIWSLFGMGEGERAWTQLKKVLPLTHSLITTTPFVMSNSYSYNEELGLDGESMSDWFTGSANALIKVLTRYVFGIRPDLDGVCINPAAYMPFADASAEITVKGKRIRLSYAKGGGKARAITLNGKAVKTTADPMTDAPSLYIETADLNDENEIIIRD